MVHQAHGIKTDHLGTCWDPPLRWDTRLLASVVWPERLAHETLPQAILSSPVPSASRGPRGRHQGPRKGWATDRRSLNPRADILGAAPLGTLVFVINVTEVGEALLLCEVTEIGGCLRERLGLRD